MKLSQIKNPLVGDSRKPLKVKVGDKIYEVAGYMPEMTIGDIKSPAHWHIKTPDFNSYVLEADIV